MANSKREAILQAVGAALAGSQGVDGRVFRSRADAIAREHTPCIVFEWTNEDAVSPGFVMAERQLTIFVSAFVRGEAPDGIADPIIQDVHARMMTNAALRALVVDVVLGNAAFEYESADKTAGKITHEYVVTFRHSYEDITQ